jgi:hypothetical protein
MKELPKIKVHLNFDEIYTEHSLWKRVDKILGLFM